MKKIDVNKIIKTHNLDVEDVSKQLFPGNKYPRLALNRIIAGKAVLDANQISKLSMLSGLSIANLFSGNDWKLKTENKVHILTNMDFKAVINLKNQTVNVFHKESLFHECVLISKSIPLTTLIHELNGIINKYLSENEKS